MIKVVISAHVHICFFLTFNPVNCTTRADPCQGRVLITAQISKQYCRTIKPSCLLDCKPMTKHHPAIFDNIQNFFQLKILTRHTMLAMNPNQWCLHSPRSSDLGDPGIFETMRYTHTANSRNTGRGTISRKLCTLKINSKYQTLHE